MHAIESPGASWFYYDQIESIWGYDGSLTLSFPEIFSVGIFYERSEIFSEGDLWGGDGTVSVGDEDF